MPPSSITVNIWVWPASEAQLQDRNVRFCGEAAIAHLIFNEQKRSISD